MSGIGPPPDFLSQRPAINELGDDVRRVAIDRGIEDGDDVRVVERAGCPCLRDEPLHPNWIGLVALPQDLQGDLTLESRIPRTVDFPATALAERRQNFVRSE